MAKWSLSNIPDLHGKTAIVTGANSGLGYYTARGLSLSGAKVIMACRNMDKALHAREELIKESTEANIEVMRLDLADLSSVKGFASEFRRSNAKLDLMINNAGLMAIPYRKTLDGFEMQFGVNHLGHFALNAYLFDLLRETEDARVVTVSSTAHNWGKIKYDDINHEASYKKWSAYGMSKLANILFSYELADRIKQLSLKIKVTIAHPGYANTKILEKGPEMTGRAVLLKAGRLANSIAAQSSEMGALPILYAATSDNVKHKGFYGPGGVAQMRGYPKETLPNMKRINKAEQVRLWGVSEEMTGVSFL